MEFELWANLGWREGLWAVSALLAVYVLVIFLRMRRLRQERALAFPLTPVATQSAVAAYAAVQEAPPAVALSETKEPLGAPEFQFPWNEPPCEVAVNDETLRRLESELTQLRKEVGGLRAEVLLLREALQRAPGKTGVAQQISPQYSEAVQLAGHGRAAGEISQQCGISRAEAELVVALVKNRAN